MLVVISIALGIVIGMCTSKLWGKKIRDAKIFSEGSSLIYCDLVNCPHIKKHKLYRGKEKPKRGNKYVNVCGRKYVYFYNDIKMLPDGRRISRTYCSGLIICLRDEANLHNIHKIEESPSLP